ncbi:MAG: capsular polysaccharide biosynthesis protein [Comamonadaceae bacterium]|nr:MAG: capsular polysaccharide biosynthesis protein [Comamonadaceae bacterium]
MTQRTTSIGLSFAQLFAILRARQLILWLSLALTIAATAGLTSILPKSYTATADIFIDFKANDPLGGRQFSPMLDESYMQTQVDMIRSEEVANQVIYATKMMSSAAAKKMIEKDGEARVKTVLAERIIKNLDVVIRKNSRVVEVRFISNDPANARDALNAAIRAYLDMVTRINLAPAKSRQEQYSSQLETLRQELDKIQASITQYQQEYEIVDADERLDIGTRQLNELTTRQSVLQSLRLEAAAKHQAISGLIKSGVQAADIPEVAQQRGIPDLRLRLTELERQMAEIGSVYGRNHPKFKIVVAERDILQQRLSRESQVALNSVLAEERRFDQQAQILQNEVQSKQKNMLEMKKHRDVIASYQRQMESVQKVYNNAVQKYDELLIASTVNSVNLSVMRWAVAPYTHSKPLLMLNLMMSVPVGLLLGMGLVFLIEVNGRRLRHVHDLERDLNMGILGRAGERSA